MNKRAQIQIKLFSSGFCTANKKHVFPNESSEKIKFCATWALIQHPEFGNILFDTGYSSRFFSATKSFPNRIYRWVTPVFHQENESCMNQLKSIGINAEDIQHIVISHFHADHIAGLHDFPISKFWCSQLALDFALSRNNFSGVLNGVLKPLIPNDISNRAAFPEKEFEKTKIAKLRAWKWTEDMFFIDLPGHYKGQLGLFLKDTNLGDVLLCADAAWARKTVQEKIYPSKIVSLFIDNYSKLTQTIDQLNEFHLQHPDVLIIPTHCDKTMLLTK
ncbi:MAG: MBL fold metallo-hydrolase [Bacteroidetes bacterium]|jgi:glyoxylase-like metal-dependent hydrolase (beta-lactamase superfamily II)|nr:MBL fold metallo-hydrolase [Bacteroidota bacterium]MBT5528489.1 MBL fold metallo-hydrolase [Cytophagia bacterium]MBT3800672.1 MBL fold metallo-hydrolase [Bacteroidota bacterium]MBT3934428.1 MBL fold metallo-hydrolase [Bacteroidota bacterium]MBT4337697.1 MBL fold metallo-hydrolase [Bacteroidota bacterium]